MDLTCNGHGQVGIIIQSENIPSELYLITMYHRDTYRGLK